MAAHEVRVVRARPADRPVIETLLRDYLREPARDDSGSLAAEPSYGHLDLYWTEASRLPLLITADDRVAGFALVNDWSPSGLPVDHAMAEFSVAPDYRRAGIGTRAALAVIGSLPGQWEIGMQAANAPARAFWGHVVHRLSGVSAHWLEGDGLRWSGPIVRFRSGA